MGILALASIISLLALSCSELLNPGAGMSTTATNPAPQAPAGITATTLSLDPDSGLAWNTDTRDLGIAGSLDKWYRVTLPAAPANFAFGGIWGNNPYTSDSPLGAAAVHAGAITNAGGSFYLKVIAGRGNYYATTSNGIASLSYGAWDSSYVIYRL
jgi:hypothetical protein